jgi:hypothetical protein
MSDLVLVALIGAVAAIIAASIGALVARNGRKLDAIHVLVNSNLTKVKVELETATQTIVALREEIVLLLEARTSQPESQ